ncbi:MAG: cell division protein FtsW [Rhodospirillales bacterium]|nr:cell division protein FtsW [Rhodospirillales bacterium]
MSLARSDQSLLARWWWTVDRWQLTAIIALMVSGLVLMLAASPSAAVRMGIDGPFLLARRQLMYMPLAVIAMLGISLATPRQVHRIAAFGLLGSLLLVAATLGVGTEIKGASRWIRLPGLSLLQPSEFVKPCFAVMTGWLLASWRTSVGLPAVPIAGALWATVVGLLLLQPDVGQAVLVTGIFGAQLFLAGLAMILVAIALVAAVCGLVAIYFLFPHVTERIDGFLGNEGGSDSYQIERSLEAFRNGGLWGRGPGEGQVKDHLPDVHSDFILAVAGEEFGLVVCLVLVALFAFVVLRGFSKARADQSLFVLLGAAGLVTQLGLQAMINMASSLSLIPTKGMTLPFISYGGSSYLALALAMGMLLALTRRRPSSETEI